MEGDLPADYAFYAGKDYYYPAKISRLKAAAAKLVDGNRRESDQSHGAQEHPLVALAGDLLPCPIIFHSPVSSSRQDGTARDQSRELLDEARRGRAIDDFMIEGDRQA